MYLKQKKYLKGNITGRSSSFIHKNILNWGSHQCPKTDLHTLLYTCTLYLDRNSQAYKFSKDPKILQLTANFLFR